MDGNQLSLRGLEERLIFARNRNGVVRINAMSRHSPLAFLQSPTGAHDWQLAIPDTASIIAIVCNAHDIWSQCDWLSAKGQIEPDTRYRIAGRAL